MVDVDLHTCYHQVVAAAAETLQIRVCDFAIDQLAQATQIVDMRCYVFFEIDCYSQSVFEQFFRIHCKLFSFNATLQNNIQINMYHKTPLSGARIHDSDKPQTLRRELNSLRRNVHEMCMRSSASTNFDCNKLLSGADEHDDYITTGTAAAAQPMTMDKIVETTKLVNGGAKRTLVDSLAPMRTVITTTAAKSNKYDGCVF
uniref:DekiORF144 n=1 Tax=Dendrolimus kikuchii nucleopolyhedrovirus TaxID=1219875 RepID=V9LSS0_9ABAC|nr:DekiORF144 [Dendrolimus kikuchii nucleopolyhedrovirus]